MKKVSSIRFLKQTDLTVYNKNIKKDINILFFSDIHYSGIKDKSRLDYLYNKLSSYKVDYIFICGDIIDSNKIIDNSINYSFFIEWMKKLSTISKVIISLGNHDIFIEKKKDIIYFYNDKFWNDINNIDRVYVLNNSYYSDGIIYVYGYTQSFDYYYKYNYEDNKQMLKEIDELKINNTPNDKLKICLVHSPICLTDNEISDKLKNYDLILSGHMHNGLMLPIIDEIFKNNRGIISPNKRLFPVLSRGIIESNNVIIISSGITKLSKKSTSFISWLNMLFPIGINMLKITNKKCRLTTSYKYHK